MKGIVFYPVASLFLFACSSNDVQETSIGDIPEWVMSPSIENGIAVSDCTIYSGNLSIDRKQAIANARVLLAAEIESKVESLRMMRLFYINNLKRNKLENALTLLVLVLMGDFSA